MATLNKVILIGNLTRDPESRSTNGGMMLCSFTLAVSHKYKSQSGEAREETLFIDCGAFGKTAELCSKYLTKGSSALIEGRLKLDQWDDKESGQKRSRIKVVVDNVQFLGQSRKSEEQSQPAAPPPPPQQRPRPQPQAQQPPPAVADLPDDDIPF